MKKYLFFILMTLSAINAGAQYHITSCTIPALIPDTTCVGLIPECRITTNAYAPGLSIKTQYPDKRILVYGGSFSDSGTYGVTWVSLYGMSVGRYTLKHVLYNGTARVDSVINSYEYIRCDGRGIIAFNDIAGTGVYDSITDKLNTIPISLQVSLNGVIIDTVEMVSGYYYSPFHHNGDVYSFKIIDLPGDMTITSPAGGIIYDTVDATIGNHPRKYFGLACTGTGKQDLSVIPSFNATTSKMSGGYFSGTIYITSTACHASPVSVTMQMSPKFNKDFVSTPSPTSISGNTVTWNIPSVSLSAPGVILVDAKQAAGYFPKYGDTVMTSCFVSPVSGDINPADNSAIIIDSIHVSLDPNEMTVAPQGFIAAGTTLKYTVDFENTGKDTAFNISIYDTLPTYVDTKSMKVLATSASMNIIQINNSIGNVVKFDFPNINLPDSSHHNQCHGSIIFTINTKEGLANGTKIDNRAGIYFDYNDVVMTNTVENIIGLPTSINTASNTSQVALYPNPANDILTINTSSGIYNTLTITNTIGQSVLTQPISRTQTKVNVKNLPSGIYYVTLRGESGITVQKLEKL